MTGPLRRAGRGTLPDGSVIAWSVAEGTRGRRWRAISTRDDRLLLGGLLELDLDGRPTRLELVSADGLLTLHPADGGELLHGNVVRRAGIDHIELAWSDLHELVVSGLPLVLAPGCRGLGARVGVGETIVRPAVLVDDTLGVRATDCRLHRVADHRWRAEPDGAAPLDVAFDSAGLPAGHAAATDWPLEA